MHYYNKISKKKLEDILEQLNGILNSINRIENILDEEIINQEIDLYYVGNKNYKNVNFNGMTYKQIISLIEYEKKQNNYEEVLLLDSLEDTLKIWFYNKLLETSCILKNPISYKLTMEMENMMYQIETFNNIYYLIDDNLIFSKQKLENLKINIMNNMHKIKVNLYYLEKKYDKMKADSEYIKKK